MMSHVVTKAFLFSSLEGLVQEKPLHPSEPCSFLFGLQPTPLGDLLIVMADKMLCGVGMVDEKAGYKDELAYLMRPWKGNLHEATEDKDIAEITERLMQAGAKPLPLLMRGAPLQIAVWLELLKIKRGETVSYQELAMRVSYPTAVRAVANAVGANRLGYIVPCHRVIRSSGHIGGFRWGMSFKKRFLEEEARPLLF